jgi:hypothetical protein
VGAAWLGVAVFVIVAALAYAWCASPLTSNQRAA